MAVSKVWVLMPLAVASLRSARRHALKSSALAFGAPATASSIMNAVPKPREAATSPPGACANLRRM
jgi:hypothetical protein